MHIKGFWIVDEDGICLFSSRWNEISTNSTIFSGFLSAIHSFTKTIGLQSIEKTQTADTIITYSYRSGLIFVLATSEDSEDELVKQLLKKLQTHFFRAFETVVWRKYLQSITNEETFAKFQDVIDDVLLMKKQQRGRKGKPDKEALKKAFTSLVHSKKKDKDTS